MTALDFAALQRRLEGRGRRRVAIPGFRESAVLVPLLHQPGRSVEIVFTVRGAALRHHAGQVAFPGGGRDAADADLAATALREAAEELGLSGRGVTPLGLLDDVPTPSAFVITPLVARVEGPLALRPAPGEVAHAFAVPWHRLEEPARYRANGERQFMGVTYVMHEYRWEGHTIWGATARILHQLLAVVAGRE